jgi:acylphosphatase
VVLTLTNYARVHILVSGKVQGVYYRQNTVQKAQELGIVGWVRNLSDGRVESVMEGLDVDIDKMLSWCKSGPKDAAVTDIKIMNEEYRKDFFTFDIVKTL